MTEARAYMPQAQKTEWETPPELFDSLWHEFGPFTLDPATMPGHYTAEKVIENGGMAYCPPGVRPPNDSWKEDGLVRTWRGRVWLNPPYGREMPQWIAKAVTEVEAGNCELVVALIPSRTDTKMWQNYVITEAGDGSHSVASANLVRFLPGRLKFSGSKDSAPFPNAIVVWGKVDG